LILLITDIAISVIFSFLNQIGEPVATIGLWVYRILMLLVNPILFLVIPFMIIENLGLMKAIQRVIVIGKKHYLKVFMINLAIAAVMFIVNYLFSLLFNVTGLHYITSTSVLYNVIQSNALDSNTLYYIVLIAYLSVLSSLAVLSSSIRVVLSNSLINEEKPKQD
jgi:hypothetical protein